MWSVGVILYTAPAGYPPFWGTPMRGVPCDSGGAGGRSPSAWGQVSDGAKNLVLQMLNKDPHRASRLSTHCGKARLPCPCPRPLALPPPSGASRASIFVSWLGHI